MLDELRPLPDRPGPQPYDVVRLRHGNTADAATDELYVVAEVMPALGGALLLYHQQHHPAYWDWAAYVDPADVAEITRVTGSAPRTWTPPPA